MKRALRNLRSALLLTAVIVAASCGESGGGSSGDPTLTFAITDAASEDVESFTVEITSVELTKLGGAVTNVLSTPVTVDLATLTDASQILSIQTIPAGTYVAAEITLDFTNSQCLLVGETTPAAIEDVDGNPLTGTLALPIQFGQTNWLHATFNRHKLLEFDFDLNQSLTADTGTNTVTVEPAFALHVDPAAPKPLIAVGELTSVDTAAGTFVADIQTLGGTSICSATFHIDTASVFQIDGVPSVGDPGLVALGNVTPGTWIQMFGTIDPLSMGVQASYVEAGTGTYNGGTDIVEGHVVDRTGGAGSDAILTVMGHSSNAAHDTFQFNATFTVSTSFASTKAVRRGDFRVFDMDDVNVGQRVRIFGALTGVTMDATGTTDVVRMEPTRIFGFSGGAVTSGVMTIDLNRVDLRPEGDFNWAGSGATPPDPDAFEVQVGTLDQGLGITAGTPVEARGFFAAVDDTDEDQVATALTNHATSPSLLFVRNLPGGITVTPTSDLNSIDLAISGAEAPGEIAVIDRGFVGSIPLPTSPTPEIHGTGALGLYVLRDKTTGQTNLYLGFATFSNALATQVGLGAEVFQVAAIGQYDVPTNVMEASIASIVIE